jgi:hypothetical protein
MLLRLQPFTKRLCAETQAVNNKRDPEEIIHKQEERKACYCSNEPHDHFSVDQPFPSPIPNITGEVAYDMIQYNI